MMALDEAEENANCQVLLAVLVVERDENWLQIYC